MWNEADRLCALRSYDILDTDTEASFSDFVQIAADVCGTPVALVSLVDEARQWFAAEIGLGVRETPLGMSVCAQAIQIPGPLVVPDLAQDTRFGDNPLVAGAPAFRFYGGATIKDPDGYPLGTICVLDDKPRADGLTPGQLATLQALARQVMNQIALKKALRERSQALQRNEALVSSLKAAIDEKDAALALKDILVVEAHHRVKNSLQTVQSLLNLQAKATDNAAAAQQLRESALRVRTFGALHEHLYRVGAEANVEMSAYLRSLLDEQKTAFFTTLAGRSVLFDSELSAWPSSDVPLVGLVLVELVTNAFKYGAGDVRVRFSQSCNEAILSVFDDGDGVPSDFDPLSSGGFGMRIVAGLLQGKKGSLTIDRTRPGTCFMAKMPLPTT